MLIHFLNLIIWSWRFSDGKVGVQVTDLISDFQFWDRSSQQVNCLLLMKTACVAMKVQSLTWLRRSLIGITFTDLLLYLSSESWRKVNHGESPHSHDPSDTALPQVTWKQMHSLEKEWHMRFEECHPSSTKTWLLSFSKYSILLHMIFCYKHRSSKYFSFNIKVKLLCIIIKKIWS